jgi:hypothetical protein
LHADELFVAFVLKDGGIVEPRLANDSDVRKVRLAG